MRRGGVFHPKFFYHARPVVESVMTATVEIFEPTGGVPKWDGGTGMSNTYNLVWRGLARIQPNKDWRARPREFAGEFDATQAVRIQVGIGKNELGMDVEFHKDFLVRVVEVPVVGAENMVGNEYYVRNALTSSNLWVYNLLCDINTKSGGQSG